MAALALAAAFVAWRALLSDALANGMPLAEPGTPAGPPVLAPGHDLPAAVFACARCHMLPLPDALPRGRWPTMIDHMRDLNDTYRLGPSLTPAELRQVKEWYAARAPEKLPALEQQAARDHGGFRPAMFGNPPVQRPDGKLPLIGNVQIVDIDSNGVRDVLVCDTGADAVTCITHRGGQWCELRVAQVPTPARATLCDVDRDGRRDLVVASLGSTTPTEDQVGAVYVLYRGADGSFSPKAVLEHAPRIADAQPADLDGDGDVDIAVAMFGMFRTGGAAWLEQTAPGSFVLRPLLQINGVSHVPVGDLDGDRRPEIVALVSQQHERVLAFQNLGQGRFEPSILYQGPHPLFGLAGMELVDLDRDGDLDALLANGDALDKDPYPKPYHGVQWLENQGGLRFCAREIARFYGAYCATAGDLDGDGDLDVVATSMLNAWDDPNAQSVIWLRNEAMRFAVQPISSSPTFQVSASLGDLDGDGRPDLVTSGMYVLPGQHRVGRVMAWINAVAR